MKISDTFERVLEKPELHLAVISITRLRAYISGYMTALTDMEKPYEDKEFDEFCRWVERRFDFRTTHNWSDIILFMAGNDERHAFEMTKKLWTEYKAEMQKKNSDEN
jgi:hypothetical protein